MTHCKLKKPDERCASLIGLIYWVNAHQEHHHGLFQDLLPRSAENRTI